jgi:hypothetical protein
MEIPKDYHLDSDLHLANHLETPKDYHSDCLTGMDWLTENRKVILMEIQKDYH